MISRSAAWTLSCFVLVCAAPVWGLDGRKPGSVLIYPIQHAGENGFTILSTTNSALESMNFLTLGGATGVHWQFLNVVPGSSSLLPVSCSISDRWEFLTPADTTSFMANCLNSGKGDGYAVVSAQDPSYFKTDWSHNFLVGSELVINQAGGVFCLNAIPFSSPQTRGSHTDNNDPGAGIGDGIGDNDGQLDFDGSEYEGIADHLYGEFIGVPGSTLTLLNLSGGSSFTASIIFDIWNDNERPLSHQLQFRCWFEEELRNLNKAFTTNYLENNTLHDPLELDLNCDDPGDDDVETGWFRIRGLNYSSDVDSCLNPALLGAITAGPAAVPNMPGAGINGGRLLWESEEKQINGDFFKFGTDDPECPEERPPVCVVTPAMQVVELGEIAMVDASASFDPDGIILSYSWEFTNPPATVPMAIASHTYNAIGTFTAVCTLVDDEGMITMCPVTIRVNDCPICDAGPNQIACEGDEVFFDGSASFDPDGTIDEYKWDFGDGSPIETNAFPKTSHVYPDVGTYTVKLKVTDNDGKSMNCKTLLKINDPPVCSVSVPAADMVVEPGVMFTVDGSGSTDSDGTIVNYSWDFGDGTGIESGAPAGFKMRNHAYAAPGTYTITLTVTDDDGQVTDCSESECMVIIRANAPPVCNQKVPNPSAVDTGELVFFDGSMSSDPDGSIMTYKWDFDDGTIQSGGPGTHSTRSHAFATFGTFTVTLTVTDNDGKTESCDRTVTVNAPPICFQKAPVPTPTIVGVNVQFDGSMSSDPDGTLMPFVWDFGEGAGDEPGLGKTPTHAYGDDGTYTVTLTVKDNNGSVVKCMKIVEVLNQLPLCDQAEPDPTIPMIGLSNAFDGSGSTDPDGTIVNYSWDWGDLTTVESGVPATHAMRSHTFTTGGIFTVTLTVTDDDGGKSMCEKIIVLNQRPDCDAGGPYMASLFVPVNFDGSASTDSDGMIVNYSWDFDDGPPIVSGPPGTHAMVSHAYENYGTFTVTLTVTDNFGATDMCTEVVEIVPVSGAIVFSGDDADQHCFFSACSAYPVHLLNWVLANSHNTGTGILAVGVQPDVMGGVTFFSVARFALESWIFESDDPAISITTITDPVALMNVDFDDYKLIYIPSYGGILPQELVQKHVTGGIRQEMLDVLFARKTDLADFTLRRGGSLLAYTQATDDKFDPQIMNAYTWAPVELTSKAFRYEGAQVNAFAGNVLMNGVPAPLAVISGDDITHEIWHNSFLPDIDFGFFGLEELVESTDPGNLGESAVIGGVLTPPIASIPGTVIPSRPALRNVRRPIGR